MKTRLLLTVALVLSPAGFAQGAGAGAVAADATVIPGGIADAQGKIGYVTMPKGGIAAIDLANGKSLWESKEATRPLSLLGTRLIARLDDPLKNTLQIIVLDTSEKGKQLLKSDPISFPDWAAISKQPGRTFSAQARVEKNALLLHWHAGAHYFGGAAPSPEIQAKARKNASGLARVDLDSGKVEKLPADKVNLLAKPIPKELEKVAAQPHPYPPFVSGNHLIAFDITGTGEKRKMVLRSWELATAKESKPIELFEGKSLFPVVSLDQRHLLVHQGLVKEQLPQGDYAWWIFTVPEGKQVAKVPFEPGMSEMTVVGSRLFSMVDKGGKPSPFGLAMTRVLRAADLKTGMELWERPIEEIQILPPPP